MNCGYCGAEVTNRLGYCLRCGTAQKAPETEEEDFLLPDLEFPELPAEEPAVMAAEAPAPEELPLSEMLWEDDLGYCPDVPALVLPTKRGLGKMVFLGILTLGIYPTVIWSRMVTELNIVASRWDGKRTMPLFAMAMLSPMTLGIFFFVWMHKFSNRIGVELKRRGLSRRFGARDFWLWNVLGMLILVGPFVYTYRLTKAMNEINQHFNSHG